MRVAALVLLAMGLTACVPWVIRPIKSEGESSARQRFHVSGYVDSIWQAKLVPAIEASAVDLTGVLAGAAPQAGTHHAVKGSARVLSAKIVPPSGVMMLDLAPFDGRADAVLQLGPVMRGSSVRDATGIIQFSQFVNQIDFANVSTELNLRAALCLPGAQELAASRGRTVRFVGAFTAEPGALPAIVPVRFEWTGGRP